MDNDIDGLGEVAGELYGLAPEDFVATRDARAREAKAAGDAELAAAVRALRKPPLGAWLLNRLVRERPEEVGTLLELGVRLRAAQGTVGAAQLKALGQERRRLTRAVAEQAAELARAEGRSISAQVIADVEETLRSAMVDPGAGAALMSGLVVQTFSSSGLEPVAVAQVVAVPALAGEWATRSGDADASTGTSRAAGAAAPVRDERAVAAARQGLEDAEVAARAAVRESEESRGRAAAARRRLEDLRSELADLRRRLLTVEERVDSAYEAEAQARRGQIAAARDERAAAEAVTRARRRLEALLEGRD